MATTTLRRILVDFARHAGGCDSLLRFVVSKEQERATSSRHPYTMLSASNLVRWSGGSRP